MKPKFDNGISAFSVYAKEANLHSTIKNHKKIKILKKKNKSLSNFGKNLTSDSSKSVMKEFLKDNEENMKSPRSFLKIAPGEIPEIGQPGEIKGKKGKKMKNKETKIDKLAVKQNVHTKSKQEKTQKSILENKNNRSVNSNGTSIDSKQKKNMKKILKKTSVSSNGNNLGSNSAKPKKNKKSVSLMEEVLPINLENDFEEESIDNKSNYDLEFIDFLDGLEVTEDVYTKGKKVLQYILGSVNIKEFFSSYWETNPMLVKRSSKSYMKGLFSMEKFDSILRNKYIEYTKNLDVTSYNGERETHNPQGRAHGPVVWDYYSNGCSLRMLNPQTFCKTVWQTLSYLQEFMGSFCGANVYLTPAGSQGFAPHWDDIEAFIIQLEGKKRWRVYNPRNSKETLPRFSSGNLTQEEIEDPVLDAVLQAGDLLYLPRGYIHQAEALEDINSLHITISAYQKTSWIDFMERLFSTDNMSSAASSSVSLRQGLPLGYSKYMGLLASDMGKEKSKPSKKREIFKKKLVSLVVDKLLTDEMVDQAADLMARDFVKVALPQKLLEDEIDRTVLGDGEFWCKNDVRNMVEIAPDCLVKLCSPYSIRVVKSADEWRLYYSIENSREYMAREEQFLVLDELHLPAIKALTEAYPNYVQVEDLLPGAIMDDKLTLAIALWERCIIMTECPLDGNNFADEISDDDDEEVIVH